ncbi:hypothetical protein B0H11DRAFT_2191485 [Mycena galericulata]|nr:hypothetical protein B0H11DRAFT_2191485 [Mycena galericulata]
MATSASKPRFLVIRLPPIEEPAFIKEEVKRANEKYAIVTAEEEKDLYEVYEEKVQAGEDPEAVKKIITDHIRYQHDLYFRFEEIMARTKEVGIDLESEWKRRCDNMTEEKLEESDDNDLELSRKIAKSGLNALEPFQSVVIEVSAPISITPQLIK